MALYIVIVTKATMRSTKGFINHQVPLHSIVLEGQEALMISDKAKDYHGHCYYGHLQMAG